jgi:hypothetical protein
VRRIVMLTLSVFLALAIATPAVMAQGSQASGKSKQIGQLSAAWWQQVLNESSTPTCGTLDRSTVPGNVAYLANFTGEVDTSCTIPTGTKVLFPVVNFACSPQLSDPYDPAKGGQDLRDECSGILKLAWEGATGVYATVDGKDVKSRVVCAESPLFDLTVPADSFLVGENLPGKVGTGPAVANGCWVLLEPLPPGEHEITFGGTFPLDPAIFGVDSFTQNATYTLTVEPHSKKK